MNQLYPLKFAPIIKYPIWGGNKLRTVLNKSVIKDNSGESWEISDVKNNKSVVSNGFLAGNDITELTEIYMGDLIGQKTFESYGTSFPILIKFIDASLDLSIQVHPNDEIAYERHKSFGKTEMWYVLQADKGAKIISGFKTQVDKSTYLKHLENNALEKILNIISVNEGDVFFIPAGRIHAIGKGILLAEIQQTSDLTYRLFDYNRKDADGNPRELHTELALDAIDFKLYNEYKSNITPTLNTPVNLAECEYFTTNLIHLNKSIERDMNIMDSFVIYMCIEGKGKIIYRDNKSENISKGETVLIPAEIPYYNIKPDKDIKLLEVYINHNKRNNANKER